MTRFSVQLFTEAKVPGKNEDAVLHGDKTIVLGDGATDRMGLAFGSESGGQVASRIATETAFKSSLNGPDLIAEVTEEITNSYKSKHPLALEDPAYRISTMLLVARISGDQLIVTSVGDIALRVNGNTIYLEQMLIDQLTSGMRSAYIHATGDVEGSVEVILPSIRSQHLYQNNKEHPLGFGVIDGTPVPAEFIKTYTFDLVEIETIEIVSDGYYGAFPDGVGIGAYERLYAHIEEVDPHKYKKYASTKSKDDRTVVIAELVS